MNKITARLLGALLVLVLVAAGCGGDDDDITTTGSSTDGAAADDGASEPGDDGEADVDPDAADCAADGDDCMQMTDGEMDADEDGGHSHGDGIEVPDGMAIPEVDVAITPDPKAGQNLEVTLTNFTVTPENASTEPVDGEGHLHLYVDGERVMRFYNEWLHLSLAPGDHTVEVEVSANNHSAYTVDGQAIRASATITVPESEMMHSHAELVDTAVDPAPTLAIEVFEDPKSGWNIRADIGNYDLAPQAASTEHVDGQGHMHLYVDGKKITRLYGSWWHLAELTEGDHEILVELSANDHRPYAVAGEPVVATTTISVSADRATGVAEDHDHDDADHDDAGHDDADHDEGMGDSAMSDADQVIEVDFAGGDVTVEDDRIAVDRGNVVALHITSDVAEHVHVHGYDLFVDVAPGEPAMVMFTADVPGVFEIEFEDSFTFITELEVS